MTAVSSCDVLVVGGGPSGLTAALAAARWGRTVRLVEAAGALGGMAASPTVAGQRVDLGSHRLHPSMPPAVRALLDELLGDDLQVRTRHGRLRLHDRWVGFPLRAADLVRRLPPGFAVAAARDLVTKPWRRAEADTYAEVVRVGLGPAALSGFHGPMAEKLWGRPAGELSGELARRRLSVRTPAALARTVARSSRPDGRTFVYPRLGYGQIVERLAEAAGGAGAILSTATSVVSVHPRPGSTRVALGSGEVVDAGRVLWTAPVGALARAVPGGGTGERAPVRSLVLAYLVVPRAQYTEFDAHYVPDPSVCFSRLSEPRNYRDGPDPSGQTVLCAEIPCDRDDERWTASVADIGEMVLDGIARSGLATPPVTGVEVRRLPAVYPVLTVDDPGRRDRTLAWADGIEGVTVLGRQGLVVADNLHHVIDMALSAVECLRDDGGWSGEAWAAHRRRFDGFVVQD